MEQRDNKMAKGMSELIIGDKMRKGVQNEKGGKH